MIRRTVSAAFLLRDGFTGRTLSDGAQTRCLLDGRPLQRPVWKRDGYLVLTDLAPGPHQLLIRRSAYQDELVSLFVRDGAALEDTISLKPGAGYRFPPETVRVTLKLKKGRRAVSGALFWLGVQPRTRLALAQEKAEAGDAQAHLFCEGSPALHPIPGHFLLADRKAPELVYLRSLRDETGEFSPPLTLPHVRGTELIAMQSYSSDKAGCAQVLLRAPGTLLGFCNGAVLEAPVHSGEQSLEWILEG
jgi:hypothetical protein